MSAVTPPPGQVAVLEAAISCIAEKGLEGTSIRQVATRASVSIGAVQHHFPTKDALLAAAMGHLEEVYRLRFERAAPPDADPASLLRLAVHTLVPTAPEDLRAASLWLAFVARAAVHPPTAAEHRRVWQRAEDGLAALVAAVHGEPADDPSPSTQDTAAGLLGLADGLAVAVLVEPERMSVERAHRMLDAAVDQVVGHIAH